MSPALRLPALVLATLLSLYAAFWFFGGVTMNALLLKSSLWSFCIAILMLFCGIASLCGIANGWKNRNHSRAPGEALAGFLIMLAFMLFNYLMALFS